MSRLRIAFLCAIAVLAGAVLPAGAASAEAAYPTAPCAVAGQLTQTSPFLLHGVVEPECPLPGTSYFLLERFYALSAVGYWVAYAPGGRTEFDLWIDPTDSAQNSAVCLASRLKVKLACMAGAVIDGESVYLPVPVDDPRVNLPIAPQPYDTENCSTCLIRTDG